MVESSADRKIESLQSDRGDVYMSTEFLSYCQIHGVHRQLTLGYALHQNGLAKWKYRSLLEGI
jgi:hypothetical protein